MSADIQDMELAGKLARLRRIKALATLVLILCFVLLLVSKWLESQYPALAILAAFAEAATIGGIADWYAVVAIFKRPMGLPIPHTAIVPRNKDRIAENMGGFIERNFLAPEPVESKLKEIDFARYVSDWMRDPDRAGHLAGFVVRLVPQALDNLERSELKPFIGRQLSAQLDKVQVAPLASEFLMAVTEEGQHQVLLDDLLGALHRFLNDEVALTTIREKVKDELPSLFNLFKADAYLMKRIVRATSSLLDEAKSDPDHPLRREFDVFVNAYALKLKHSPELAEKAQDLKADLLARPEVRALADKAWDGVRDYIIEDAASDSSAIRAALTEMFVEVGRNLAEDDLLRRDMNAGFVATLSSVVESQKGGVSTFIADQVKGWDMASLIVNLEANVGKDLQYIRFNGMIIGGIVGLILFGIERLILG